VFRELAILGILVGGIALGCSESSAGGTLEPPLLEEQYEVQEAIEGLEASLDHLEESFDEQLTLAVSQAEKTLEIEEALTQN